MPYSATKQKAMAELRFKPAGHRYTASGLVVPSVTQVVDTQINAFYFVPESVRQDALQRGTLVHKLTEIHDKAPDRYEGMAYEVEKSGLLGYVLAWEKFKRERMDAILETEQLVYHTKYRYAGTLDRVMLIDGLVTVVEIKTGGIYPEYAWQTAAYLAAYNEGQTGVKAEKRLVVTLQPDGKYAPTEHKEKADFEAFLAAITMMNWRARYK